VHAASPIIPHTASGMLVAWDPVTTEEIVALIGKAPNKTGQLDPLPSWLVKQFAVQLAPFIAILFNKSLATGCFPTSFKHAVVLPLLKKENLDPLQLKNYRPVSTLSFVSKLLERVVQGRLLSYLDETGCMPQHQSAYRQYHGTETALLKLYNDLLLAADRGEVSALCLLDLTAAFDTVDHEVLFARLEHRFGIVDGPLAWFKSYLTDRSFAVFCNGSLSKTMHLLCSVPQGSVLGPLLFILYTDELYDIAKSMGVILQAYADDIQLYLHCRLPGIASTIDSLQQCIGVICNWMSSSRLKLNVDKTEVLWLGTNSSLQKLSCEELSLRVGSSAVTPAGEVKLLGVIMTPDLSLAKHVSAVSASCFYQLRQLRCVTRNLDQEAINTVVHAFITSRIDYCCSLLIGSPKSITDRLQRVVNAAARVVTGTRRYDRGLSSLLHDELHWLDMRDRIRYRVAVIVHNCMQGRAPAYLARLCEPVALLGRRYNLRSADRDVLTVPRYKLKTYGARAFAVAGPTLWNSLPDSLRNFNLSSSSFKHNLKTFLFSGY
jgi:Reverse transcriptase (RNA-dependent DNA polymerase)